MNGKTKKQERSTLRIFSKDSVLWQYLEPSNANKEENDNCALTEFLYPFGANTSQMKAVKNAFNNPISVIQGPPGTGKTQTILNIIANALLRNEKVLVVSNNNEAISNVYQKLKDKKLEFLCAFLGKGDNVNNFLDNQQLSEAPSYIKEWEKDETKALK